VDSVYRPSEVSTVVVTAVIQTRQRDEIENARDISRIVETFGTLGAIFRKTGGHRLRNFYHFKEGQDFMAITVMVKSSRHMGFSARISA
jgi:hypothetical protein